VTTNVDITFMPKLLQTSFEALLFLVGTLYQDFGLPNP